VAVCDLCDASFLKPEFYGSARAESRNWRIQRSGCTQSASAPKSARDSSASTEEVTEPPIDGCNGSARGPDRSQWPAGTRHFTGGHLIRKALALRISRLRSSTARQPWFRFGAADRAKIMARVSSTSTAALSTNTVPPRETRRNCGHRLHRHSSSAKGAIKAASTSMG
jgi:hypothetical protein